MFLRILQLSHICAGTGDRDKFQMITAMQTASCTGETIQTTNGAAQEQQ